MAVATINKKDISQRKSESPWKDSLYRLLQNRAAVIGIIFIIFLIIVTLLADTLATAPYDKQTLSDQNVAPEWVVNLFPSMSSYVKISDKYILGADKLGRDLFSRILYGGRVSLAVALFAPVFSLLIGISYGAISGFAGGKTDTIMMRIVDVLYAFPSLLFIILLMTYFKGISQSEAGTFAYFISRLDASMNGILFIFIGIGLTSWHTMARLTRGQVLSVRNREYIEAARTLGADTKRIITRHVLPNIIGPLIITETLAIPSYISTEAFLSFIGIGVNPPMPSWGSMISSGAEVIRSYPNQAIFPALVLAATMFAFNFLGDGLRDALDPRLRGSR
jgi:oligopeptide transport system permease protein